MKERLSLAITCFPTFGGSGLIATEIGLAMAARGHRVHFIARDLPVRLHGATQNVVFHEVTESDYPALTQSSSYPIALASKMIEVARNESLDVLHVHYAVPHATAAWMACEVLGPKAPKLVTTLHGTDITLVGTDPSHLPITRFSILKSDAVTTPSVFLRNETWERLEIERTFPIEVIANFVDTKRFAPSERRERLKSVFPTYQGEPVLFHVSTFRPVKRTQDVVSVFVEVQKRTPARLIMVGDGPERAIAERRIRDLGLGANAAFLGKQDSFADLLAAASVFLLPSQIESFGLAALEALSCGVPVVASNVGGIPEVVVDGETGILTAVGDVKAMVDAVVGIVKDEARWRAFSRRARADAEARFQMAPAMDAYEKVYRGE